MSEPLQWYIAVQIFRRPGEGDPPSRVDHRFVLLHSRDGETAYQRALFLGRKRAATWGWEFAGLHELEPLGAVEMDDGGEVRVTTSVTNIADGCLVFTAKLLEDQAWGVTPKDQLMEFAPIGRSRRQMQS